LIKALYCAAFGDSWGYIPISEKELNRMIATLKRYFDPEFVFFAYVKDEPVGFIMGVPDFNQVLQKARPRPGVPEFITLLRAIWYWKFRPTMNWLRVALLGVKLAHRPKGVAAAAVLVSHDVNALRQEMRERADTIAAIHVETETASAVVDAGGS
jgi:hypothetical protein